MSPAANPWLAAMGVSQLQLREPQSTSAGAVYAEQETAANVAPMRAEQAAAVMPEQSMKQESSEVGAVTAPLADEPVSVESSVNPEPAIASKTVEPSTDLKVIPLLIIWDEKLEKTVAGAGSLPAGELGDLLANIIQAVGLTEDVVEAWSRPPEDLQAKLLSTGRAPLSIWHFGATDSAQLELREFQGLQNSVQCVDTPALKKLQQDKRLKADLWKLLKPLVSSGLWR